MEEVIPDADIESVPCSRLLAAGLVIVLILSPGFIMVMLQIADLGIIVLFLLWVVLVFLVAVIAYHMRNLHARRTKD